MIYIVPSYNLFIQYIELTDLSLSVYLTYQGVGRALTQPRNTHLHQFLCSNQPETSEKFSADCRKNLLRCLTSSNFRISMDPLKKNTNNSGFSMGFPIFSDVLGQANPPKFTFPWCTRWTHWTSQAARQQRRALEGHAQHVAVLQGCGAPL